MNTPLIGITVDANAQPGPTRSHYDFYASSVERGGGKPFPIPYREDLSGIPAILDEVQGMLFSGGDDLDPALYGQAWHPNAKPIDPVRQRFELALLAESERRRLPILGICLGVQLMNVHRGGSLIQFLPDYPRKNPLEHRKLAEPIRRHPARIVPDSLLGRTLGKTEVSVNTYHKQAVDRPGRGLRVVAQAPDGVVEALEDVSGPLFLGVQWHPERISEEPEHLALFQLLAAEAGRQGR